MTYKERTELLTKCSTCPYTTEMDFMVDSENELVGKYYSGRKFQRKFRVCKMYNLICREIERPCPLPELTEDEIEERETEFDEMY